MNLFTVSAEVGQVGQTLGAGSFRFKLPPVPAMLVHVSCNTTVDDAGLTFNVQDDGTDVLTAIDLALTATNGEWNSTHFGGTNAPIAFAGGSIVEVDAANAAADSRFQFVLTFLM